MIYTRKWEEITNEYHAGCSRLKVFGGWLVVSWSAQSKNENIIFISDPKHEWILGK